MKVFLALHLVLRSDGEDVTIHAFSSKKARQKFLATSPVKWLKFEASIED